MSHFGGHCFKNNIDYGVLDYLIKKYDIKSMVDVGCGPPKMVEYAKSLDIDAIGIDGDPELFPNDLIIQHDFTKGTIELSNYDLCYSIEFLEHVELEYLPNIMDVFSNCKYVVCTHATEVGNGHHHVNCQSEDWWIKTFRQYDFKYDENETRLLRAKSTMKKYFMHRTGKFFINMNFSKGLE